MKKRFVKTAFYYFPCALLAACAALLLGACPLEPGVHSSLDHSFAENGVFRLLISSSNNYGRAIAVTAGGSIIVGGDYYESGQYHIALLCLGQDGALYMPFGALGVRTNTTPGLHSVKKIVIQPDGKIVVAAEYYNTTGGTRDFAVLRYTQNGDVDATFSADGMAVTDIDGDLDQVLDIALQPDGRIVAAGYTMSGGHKDIVAVRYNANGSLDTTFADNGIFVFATADQDDWARTVAVTSDGKILLAGDMDYVTYHTCAIAMRLNADGSIDDSYGFLGLAIVEPSLHYETCVRVEPHLNNKTTLYGHSGESGGGLVLSRRLYAGGPDTSFGLNGKIILDMGHAYDYCVGGYVDEMSNLVAACSFSAGTGSGIAVVKCRNDGTLVASFGNNNGIETTYLLDSVTASGLSHQADGKILVVGTATESVPVSRSYITVTRYLP